MYILTLKDKEGEGALAVSTQTGDKVLQLFEEYDDAQRYIVLLEADNFLDLEPLEPMEIEPEQAIAACERFGYNYVVITSDDFVIPPFQPSYDFI